MRVMWEDMYVSTEALGVGVLTGILICLFFFFELRRRVCDLGIMGRFDLFFSLFFPPIRIYVYYMCLSDSCVTCVSILFLCDLKRLSEMLMGWAMSVYKHPCVSYELEDIPEEFQSKYINRLNLFNKTAFKTWVCHWLSISY